MAYTPSNTCFRRHTTLNTPCNRKVARLCQDIQPYIRKPTRNRNGPHCCEPKKWRWRGSNVKAMLFRSRIAGTEVLDMRQPRIKSPPRERQRLGRGVSRRLVRGGECDSNACFRRHTTLNTPCNRTVARLCQNIHLHPKTNPEQKRPALLRAVKVEVAITEPNLHIPLILLIFQNTI